MARLLEAAKAVLDLVSKNHSMPKKSACREPRECQKSWRKLGKLPRELLAAQRIMWNDIVERCRRNEEAHIKELERLALNPFSESVRLTVIDMLLNRSHGKAVQHNDTSVSGELYCKLSFPDAYREAPVKCGKSKANG